MKLRYIFPIMILAAAVRADDFLPFQPDPDHFSADAAFDLRSLNEKFAGEHGVIAAKDGHFIHSATGEQVRFWAVNNMANASEPAELERTAKILAKRGVNLVRLHGPMFNDHAQSDPAKIQLAINTVEALKAQGIYTEFSIYFPLWLTPNPQDPLLEGYGPHAHPFATLMFNPEFQKQYQSWWTALLTTPSAKTGKKLVDDPAVAILEIQNEDSFFFWTFSEQNFPGQQLRMLESQFADWLIKRHGSLDKALARWKSKPLQRDNPEENRIAFRPLWNIFHDRTLRDKETAQFLLETQTNFYKQQVAFLRNLGYKGLITASNWTTANARILGPLEKLSYLPGDFIDRHGYFGDNHKGDSAAWSIRNGHTYTDRSALRFDPETPGKPKNFTNPVEDVSYNNLPSTITETTFERPNRYRSEAPLFYAAYASLQDTDAVVHFALDTNQWKVKPNYFMQPWTLMSPAMMGQFPAAALIYRKSLIAPGEVMINLNIPTADLLQLEGSPLAPESSFDELRLADVPRSADQLVATSTSDPLIHFVGRTNINFTGIGPFARPNAIRDPVPFIDRKKQRVTSSNGQLVLDYGRGVLTFNAPQVQGASGNLKLAGEMALPAVTLKSDLDLAHIVVVSLDDRPLATSGRMLLQVMSEEKSKDFATEDTGTQRKITNIGHDPWMIRALQGSVRLNRADAADLKVTALDANGMPGRSPVQSGNAIQLAPTTLYYLISR